MYYYDYPPDELTQAEKYALKWVALCERFNLDPNRATMFEFKHEYGIDS